MFSEKDSYKDKSGSKSLILYMPYFDRISIERF